jgi:hypothetical protein
MLTNLLVIAAGVLVTEGNPENIPPSVVVAFAMVESSGREQAVGDNGLSWGLYQFRKARWAECGGRPDDWGKAGAVEQTRVMARALTRYARNARKNAVGDRLQWMATCHNIGHGKAVETPYVAKIRKEVAKCQ